ncbi:putative piggybac transposable element-derived [Nephila pilipes]|uniref:Putative piggybac transposable element-derived n=1 Tax=Nephila pilipes TaxID=299642 RepID=A0A8X6UEB6_NEPPI|nr:putative piggybac transposable element-derived [Nephila pilipes]
MSRKKVFKTTEEAVEHLFSEELESEMIVLPPEVDEFTDEEGFDDSETLDPSVRDIICPIICKLSDLKKSGFRATGAIRSDRIHHCQLEIDSTFKKTSRGSHDFYFDVKNKITSVKWNDNKCVTFATNFDIIEQLTSVSRHEKGKTEKNKIEQLCLVNNYNKNMGDMDVVNTYVIYNMVNAEKKSIKEIRRHIAIAYLKTWNTVQIQIRIPSYTISSRVKEIDTVTRDGVGHIISKREKQR